ncbi:2-oxoglutarate dehydrogenase E1 component [Coemansia sp. BCRC 34301]|nr:2-oxoglutarate dehydrogenase E1 component [Coemansia sp. BCRC 34301]
MAHKGRNGGARGGQKHKPGRYLTRNPNSTVGGGHDDFSQLNRSLKKSGLYCKDIAGDGNCLFRALADQVDGTPDTHLRHREAVCDYMHRHPDEFSPFLDETCSFDRYLDNMRRQGVFGGNLELVAFARNYCVDIKVYQLGGTVFVISGGSLTKDSSQVLRSMPTVHLAYHSYEHYSSVRNCTGPHDGLPNPTITLHGPDDDDDSNDSASPTDVEKIVMDSTGVENHSLVRNLLQKHQHHSDTVIELLIQWMADEEDAAPTDSSPWWTKDGSPTYDGPRETPEVGQTVDDPACAKGDDDDEESVPDKVEEPPTPPPPPPPLQQRKKGAARQKKAESKKRQKEMAKLKKRTAARQEGQNHTALLPKASNPGNTEQANIASSHMSHIYI